MKLRTKLVIVFLTVMILPVIFMTIAVYAIGPGEYHDRASDLLDLPVGVRAAVKASEGGAQHKGRKSGL